MALLGVNVDHVATLREARGGHQPDPVHAAVLAEMAGASGITAHLREDRRHIQNRDIYLLKQTIGTRLNLEMAPSTEIVNIALDVVPWMVTLVPEKREEQTTEGGLAVASKTKDLSQIIDAFHENNIKVSLFTDPEIHQVKAAKRCNADCIELHTGYYANAKGFAKREELEKLRDMALAGDKLGLVVNAGHGLDYQNVSAVADIELIEELNIGHSIVSRAVCIGIDAAIRDMLALL